MAKPSKPPKGIERQKYRAGRRMMVCANLNADAAAEFEKMRLALAKSSGCDDLNNGEVIGQALVLLAGHLSGRFVHVRDNRTGNNLRALVEALEPLPPGVAGSFAQLLLGPEFDAERFAGMVAIDDKAMPMAACHVGHGDHEQSIAEAVSKLRMAEALLARMQRDYEASVRKQAEGK